MLLTALATLYVTVVAAMAGRLVQRFAVGPLHLDRGCSSPVTTVLAGLAMIASISTLVSLGTALSGMTHMVIVAVIIVCALGCEYRDRGSIFIRLNRPALIDLLPIGIVGVTTVLLITRTTRPPDHYDVGLYHAQSIKWLHDIGTVPGLGNVHTPFAHNSEWHVIAALFDFTWLAGAPLAALNVVIIGSGLILAASGLRELVRGNTRLSSLVATLLAFPLTYFFVEEFSSPITDTPAAVLGWIVFVLLLRRTERDEPFRVDTDFLLTGIILAFWITIKLSAAPAALVFLIVLARSWRSPRRLMLISLPVAAVVIPWMLRGVVLSGFVAFPLALIPPLPVDWAMPSAEAADQTRTVQSWAKVPFAPAQDIASLALREWIPLWWARQNALRRAFIPIALCSLPVLLALCAVFCRQTADRRLLLISGVFSIWTVGAWFWFLGAPDPRYGLGFLIPLVVALCALLLFPAVRSGPRQTGLILGIALLIFQSFALRTELPKLRWQERWFVPAQYIQTLTKPVPTNGIQLRVPVLGDQCWDSLLPCTPTPNAALQPRGCSLRDGFRMIIGPNPFPPLDCRIVARPDAQQGNSIDISTLRVYRRNENDIRKLQCVAGRRNIARVTLENGGPTSLGPIEVQVTIDSQEPIASSIATISSGEERSMEFDVQDQMRVGSHRVIASARYGIGSEISIATQTVDFDCVNP